MRRVTLASHKNCSRVICKELCQGTMNSPIKLQITLTDAYKACLEAVVYVCVASSGNEEVIYNPKTTNDGILQMLYPIILCTTIKFIIYNRIPKYLLHTCITDNQKDSCLLAHTMNLLEWEIRLCPFHGNSTE